MRAAHGWVLSGGVPIIAILALLTLGPTAAWSQDAPARFELGGNFTASHVSLETFGPGVDGSVNFGRHIAFDAGYSWLPTPTPQHIMTAFFGAKAGMRTEHFGFFGKVRPGLISFGDAVRSVTIDFGPNGISSVFRQARQTEKALDLGGVLEYYPARHWALRWDAGDMVVFGEPGLTSNLVGTVPPNFVNPPPEPAQTTNNFLFSTGVRYRF
jgi:hypothetical protein